MLDPIGGFDRIRDFFISYVETSFRIADKGVAAERRRLLETTDVFATASFVEPVLRYRQNPLMIDEMVGLADGPIAALPRKAQIAFAELALSGLFDGKDTDGEVRRTGLYPPYVHQAEMLERGLRPGSPGIVTSGTGSGKTESFMLPILASIANEATAWSAPGAGYLQNRWWEGKSTRWSRQRAGETRPAALRALVLYPMNALVEDQMVRLRRTLDSDEARNVMDERFAGNRIFFGQYTSSTPVTGYERHPRKWNNDQERKRRQRHQRELRIALREADADQRLARDFDAEAAAEAAKLGEKAPEKTRFIFPSMDGGEMMSRWDMQATPPDLLVTNASMLGAMLSREVEESIFAETRKWLLENDDAYFYLVFDELHLIRGSAGTEISFLVKSLVQRLGLDDPAHRYKLRILASSASLPMDGEPGDMSRRYLRDLFAPFGTSANAGDEGAKTADFWKGCVVKGEPEIPVWNGCTVPVAPFAELLAAARCGNGDFIAKVNQSEALDAALAGVASAFGVTADGDARVARIAEAAAALLTHACRAGDGVRATSIADVAKRLFPGAADGETGVRGLMLARALPESGLASGSVRPGTPSFRIHSFVRNVEGLFGAPVINGEKIGFVDLSVERGLSHGQPEPGQARGRRLFELLYCEACGDLLIGGQRGRHSGGSSSTELLPSTAELENLPERAAAEYYDRMTLEQFAVFWPSRRDANTDAKNLDVWEKAYLDPASGVVALGDDVPEGRVGGHIYHQNPGAKANGQKTAQPFCCPKCGTDYSGRPQTSHSRSPIRAFRTGVSKASQLVATELFELLHAVGTEAKSIVFSDSRQDAANQSLEIERLHLRDLRREILVTVARDYLRQAEEGQLDRKAALAEIDRLMDEGEDDAANALMTKLKAQTGNPKISLKNRKIQLSTLFDFKDDTLGLGALVSEYVGLGIHPFDELGRATISRRPWYEAFVAKDGKIRFAPWLDDSKQSKLGDKIRDDLLGLVDDVIFANTFFALEETGLAYPSVSKDDGEEVDRLDAWLRVFASATRVQENKFFKDSQVVEWHDPNRVPHTNRVRKFADGVYGPNAMLELGKILSAFADKGHVGGIIRAGSVFLRIAKEGDPYWRCGACERVHLHRGVGNCTRCYAPLSSERTGPVEDLWNENFLGRRIVRGQQDGVARFRLRCEELTGQTDDFSDRLRKFKSIFVDDLGEVARLAREIDMLSVTTTMEVGIDIGSLQTVYQANMPPQRFNYQQRVGRAGRRGQAFSFVVTFCRGRSHDAYYFAHPGAITGDPPPPPFLATGHDPIPLRLLRKVWLRSAFRKVRDDIIAEGGGYPGDELVPPDVHGEYLPTKDYYEDPDKMGWVERLRGALKATIKDRDDFLAAAIIDPKQRERLREKCGIKDVMDGIERERKFMPFNSVGLAQFLAERGLLPMYGMPTRVKQLYLGLRADSDEQDADYLWSTMDRDLDTAVFEFAPGAVLTKDKLRHKVVGFTGTMAPPERRGRNIDLAVLSEWRESNHLVAMCSSCGSASYAMEPPKGIVKCDDCAGDVLAEEYSYYVTPAAFRTEFEPVAPGTETVGRMAVRTVATIMHDGETVDVGNLRVLRGAGVTIMQLNDGADDGTGTGQLQRFTVDEAEDDGVPVPRLNDASLLNQQAIDFDNVRNRTGNRYTVSSGTRSTFGLIARKETDALYLELLGFDPRLTLDHVAREGLNKHLPTRSAAISATQVLVQKAALDLDVSSDEFEALEPRLRKGRPMLQIADSLINGSGLSRRLGFDRTNGTPYVIGVIRDILEDREAWPLLDFLKEDAVDGDHAARCQTSCYRCIQRYGNRSYHGLLDWRLGLSYLRALVTPDYSCGLDEKDRSYPETAGWQDRSLELARSVASMRPNSLLAKVHKQSGLPSIEDKSSGATMLIVHPLWRTDGDFGRSLAGGEKTLFVDTFNLERRPMRALEDAKAM